MQRLYLARAPMIGLGLAFALGAAPLSWATWSIAIADRETGEVGLGTITCLDGIDLMAVVPVVVVGRGTAAVSMPLASPTELSATWDVPAWSSTAGAEVLGKAGRLSSSSSSPPGRARLPPSSNSLRDPNNFFLRD